jgi:hypothetical protein
MQILQLLGMQHPPHFLSHFKDNIDPQFLIDLQFMMDMYRAWQIKDADDDNDDEETDEISPAYK